MNTLIDAHAQCAFMRIHAKAHGYRTIDLLFSANPELFNCLSIIFRQLITGDFIQ